METIQHVPGWRILRSESEVQEGLRSANIDPASVGIDPSYSFEKLAESCDKNHMFLAQNDRRVELVVCVAVVILQCHVGQNFFELKEDRQVFKGSQKEIRRDFRGIAETIERNGTARLTRGHITNEAYRTLGDELGQTMPLFKERYGYGLTRRWIEITRQQHDKWPHIPARFVRFIHLAYLCNSKLHCPEYVEDTPTKTIYFSWHPAELKNDAKFPVMVPLP